MAEQTTNSGQSAVADPPKAPSKEEQFKADQAAAARAQGLEGDNAVPEQRPIASQQSTATTGDFANALNEQGVNVAGQKDSEPMGKDAYDKASKRAENEDYGDERHEAIKIADTVRITDKHPVKALRGVNASVLRRVSYDSVEDESLANAGTPESRFVQPKEVEIQTRGGDAEQRVIILTKYLEKIPAREFRTNG